MVPIWAVKAEPDRPAMMMAVMSHADLAQDTHAQKIDGEDLGPEALQLIGALIGQHHADQERQQAHGRQGIDAGLLDLVGSSPANFRLLRGAAIASSVSTVTRPRYPSMR